MVYFFAMQDKFIFERTKKILVLKNFRKDIYNFENNEYKSTFFIYLSYQNNPVASFHTRAIGNNNSKKKEYKPNIE